MIMTETRNTIITIALQLLKTNTTPTIDTIRSKVHDVIDWLRTMNQIEPEETIDEEQIIREIESLCNVSVPLMSALDDKNGHQEWLTSKNAQLNWRFWDRYRSYLEEVIRWPPQSVRRLDEVTNQTLGRLEDPTRPGAWDRRGIVVGQVQSGKTANYVALICKAADAGYKLIVVLAGVHNSLRSQTQLRLDEGFLGFDTQKRSLFDPGNSRLGVGRLTNRPLYHVHSLTNSHDKGDFSLKVARQANVMIGGAEPVLLVVKKNTSVLQNLLKWATSLQTSNNGTSSGRVPGVPLLLIDDEADNASINTNPALDENGRIDPDQDPSKINGLIRNLLNSFEQSAYVGYTATPFANIFIADNVTHEKVGEDLFPRSFIINLQPPSNYFGPARLFGLSTDSLAGEDTIAGVPLIKKVSDFAEWMPDKHKKEHVPHALPDSVRQAIKAFVLTCAVRQARGHAHKHNSMLIHVTRFTAVQSKIAEQVQDELSFIQQRLRYGDGNATSINDELKFLWDTDFEPTMKKFQEPDLTSVTWQQVQEVLYSAAAKIEVRKINGTARDTLQYIEHPDGLNVICIGGDKLSRGLTLEGLSISYYLRASTMYDTLMQMGRWFGYRTGYVDLCRLYTTSQLLNWYRDITSADEELREMFVEMAYQEKTPEEYGLGVRTHPDLMITAPAKMRNVQKIRLSYSSRSAETVVFLDNAKTNSQNLQAVEELIHQIECEKYPFYQDQTENYIWKGVEAEFIANFLESYSTNPRARTVQSSALNKYIKTRVADGELVEWTVALISNQRGVSQNIAGHDIGQTERQRLDKDDLQSSNYRIRRLISPKDETIDLTVEELDQALQNTQTAWKKNPDQSKRKEQPKEPSGIHIRRTRPAQRGLLLLYILKYEAKDPSVTSVPITGMAISFPESWRHEEAAIEYAVNNTYWNQETGV